MGGTASTCYHDSEASVFQGFGIFKHKLGGPVGADDPLLVPDSEIVKNAEGSGHYLEVACGPHDDSDFHDYEYLNICPVDSDPVFLHAPEPGHLPFGELVDGVGQQQAHLLVAEDAEHMLSDELIL